LRLAQPGTSGIPDRPFGLHLVGRIYTQISPLSMAGAATATTKITDHNGGFACGSGRLTGDDL